jgi:uncharacterized membrane protein YcaP (DUF421 family)
MDAIIRALVVYVVLLLLFRLSGKRSVAQMTTFDFVLLLIISETVQQALTWRDQSMLGAFMLVVTLMVTDIGISLWKRKSRALDKIVESVPLVLVDHGKPILECMQKARVDEDDVLTAARELRGLERMDQIKYAVLERSGGISIIPASGPQDKPATT